MTYNTKEEIIVKDNFLPKSLFGDIKSCLLSENVNWRFLEKATSNSQVFEDDMYFVHGLYGNKQNEVFVSPQYDIVRPMLYFIDDKLRFNIEKIIRINCTLITQRLTNKVTTYHTDMNDFHYVGIYYLNTCNGPTMIQDKKIDFIENRFVFFNGKYDHAAVHQTDTYLRLNIVFNFYGNFY
jgi:hypothetical protein